MHHSALSYVVLITFLVVVIQGTHKLPDDKPQKEQRITLAITNSHQYELISETKVTR